MSIYSLKIDLKSSFSDQNGSKIQLFIKKYLNLNFNDFYQSNLYNNKYNPSFLIFHFN